MLNNRILAPLLLHCTTMKPLLFITLLLVIFTSAAHAQDKGKLQAGLRLGLPLGGTVRYFFNDANAVEGIAGGYSNKFTATGLYEHHFDLSALTTNGLSWFVGGGAHIGGWKDDDHVKFLAGVDGIAGIDYTFPSFPLNLSVDWKPAIHFNAPDDLPQFALSVRYVFGR
jgi:hypothetical protein